MALGVADNSVVLSELLVFAATKLVIEIPLTIIPVERAVGGDL